MTFPHDLLGRRYEFIGLTYPDFTVISYNTVTDDVYVHGEDGGKQHLRLNAVIRCIRGGTIQESVLAPFVLSRHEGRKVTS